MLKLLLGDPNARKLKRYQPIVSDINLLEEEIEPLSDDDLRRRTAEFRQRLEAAGPLEKQRPVLDDLLPEAFAVVREAGKRVLGMRHFDVQMIGGMVLHEGQIAEMKTGEGKTLVATLPSYLNALTGRGVHVVTVNDYLARRDAEWMGQVHRFLGLSVGLIQQDMSPAERRINYGCDITYATNSELGFDYLRDNMAADINEVVQREFQFCVIDEVDSILIDEARTPLIISGQVERPQEKYEKAVEVANALERAAEMGKDGIDPEGDYEVDEKQRSSTLTDEGFAKAEALIGVEDLYNPQDPWAHYITNALKAKELFVRDVNYIVRDGEAVIVDEFTHHGSHRQFIIEAIDRRSHSHTSGTGSNRHRHGDGRQSRGAEHGHSALGLMQRSTNAVRSSQGGSCFLDQSKVASAERLSAGAAFGLNQISTGCHQIHSQLLLLIQRQHVGHGHTHHHVGQKRARSARDRQHFSGIKDAALGIKGVVIANLNHCCTSSYSGRKELRIHRRHTHRHTRGSLDRQLDQLRITGHVN